MNVVRTGPREKLWELSLALGCQGTENLKTCPLKNPSSSAPLVFEQRNPSAKSRTFQGLPWLEARQPLPVSTGDIILFADGSKPGSLERRVVLVSREEGTGWQSPQAQGGHAVAILTKRGWQPLRSEPQASLRGY